MPLKMIRSVAAAACSATAFTVYAAGPHIISYAAETPVPVELTLFKKAGNVGREHAFFNGYRPQFVFSGMKEDVTCSVQFPEPAEKVEPGESAEASITCIKGFKVVENELRFRFLEGGREVGSGTLRP
jgi:translation elongation factor EF-Tu-like GTPase